MPKHVASDLQDFLVALARNASPGDRLPAIRELMKRFGVSQVVVQRLLQDLKSRGLIASEVGRGTFFRGGDTSGLVGKGPASRAGGGEAHAPDLAPKSILLLRRSISVTRGRVLVDGVQRKFADEGHRVLEVAYTDPEHARVVLKGLPRFDACVVQSTFKAITIELLADLRSKCDVLAVDGTALSGADVEAVGMEWGEPLEEAVTLLRQQGHQRIAYATTTYPFLAGQLGQRRFDQLQKRLTDAELHRLPIPRLPHEDYDTALVQQLVELMAQHPVTGLVAWGIEDGRRFYELLAQAGLSVPGDLSVVLLGRTDLANEHAQFFHCVGCQVGDQIEQLHQAVKARWAEPSAPYVVRLIPVTVRQGASVASPVKAGKGRRASAAA
jgi:DNA-binding LacI/PurR family transcriptional regulator